jgi:predicted NAD/FAD-binding protein
MPSDAGELGSMSAAGAAAGVAEPLLAGGRFGVWWFALPLVAGVVIGTFGVLLWAAGHPVWPPVLCVAGGLLLLGSVAGVAIRRTRRWISVLPDGFVIADRDGERHIHDAQVCGLAYRAPALLGRTSDGGHTATGALGRQP